MLALPYNGKAGYMSETASTFVFEQKLTLVVKRKASSLGTDVEESAEAMWVGRHQAAPRQ